MANGRYFEMVDGSHFEQEGRAVAGNHRAMLAAAPSPRATQ